MTEGFPTEPMGYPPEASEVRGAMFFSTVFRELYYTQLAGDIFEANQLLTGNRPLGVWKYEFSHPTLKNDHSAQIDRFCGLFETLGDRRLATNLFQGLELLVDAALSAEKGITQATVDELVSFFKAKGRFDEKKQIVTATWKLKHFKQPKVPVFHHEEGKEVRKDPGQLHSDFIKENLTYTDEENESLVDLVQEIPLGLERVEETLRTVEVAMLKQEITQGKPVEDGGLTDSILDEFKSVQTSDLLKALALIYARCGAECGKTLRLLDEAEISWGYFYDHNPFEPHCNAHANNFIVVDPTQN